LLFHWVLERLTRVQNLFLFGGSARGAFSGRWEGTSVWSWGQAKLIVPFTTESEYGVFNKHRKKSKF